jgi:hypothetical protein
LPARSCASAASIQAAVAAHLRRGRSDGADVVTALAHEADAAAAHVQPRAHAIALLWRAKHARRGIERHARDTRERVADDVGFQLELPLVVDVREHVAAAAPVGHCVTPVR